MEDHESRSFFVRHEDAITTIIAGLLVLIGLAIVIGGIAWGINAANTKTETHKTERGRGDAPRPEKNDIDGRPVDGVTEMIDGFPNVATKCVWDGWRAFVTSNGDAIHVVEDPDCEHVGTGPNYKPEE